MNTKPRLSTADIWNMSVGFLGIQMGFALQNGNASRILQSFGADVHELSWFWLVAPLTGMIVQPIVGYYSDRTWGKYGRRKPYFLVGAIIASLGLILMPNADMFVAFLPAIWVGAGMLMIMDASFNIAMEPFRALVADKLPAEQRTKGFSVQTILIGIGAVVGSWLPYFLAEFVGVEKIAAEGSIPANVIWSFVIGAICLITAILWTFSKTTEYSPEEMEKFLEDEPEEEEAKIGLMQFFSDFKNMPKTMKQLGLVQFFSWFALFLMWVYSTSAIAQHIYGLPIDDSSSETYQNAGNWVGILFGVYNFVSAIFAFFLPRIADSIGRKKTHAFCLVCGGLGLLSVYFLPTATSLILSMIGIGIAWASILAMPYAILAGSIPLRKMGIYMGIFNLFITIPQVISAITGGFIVKELFGNYAIYMIMIAAACMFLAAFSVLGVEDRDDMVLQK